MLSLERSSLKSSGPAQGVYVIILGRWSARRDFWLTKCPASSLFRPVNKVFLKKFGKEQATALFSAVEPNSIYPLSRTSIKGRPPVEIPGSLQGQPRDASNWKLLVGDVLLSKCGTIGKVGIVRNGAVGNPVAATACMSCVRTGLALTLIFSLHISTAASAGPGSRTGHPALLSAHLTKRIMEEILVPPASLADTAARCC